MGVLVIELFHLTKLVKDASQEALHVRKLHMAAGLTIKLLKVDQAPHTLARIHKLKQQLGEALCHTHKHLKIYIQVAHCLLVSNKS